MCLRGTSCRCNARRSTSTRRWGRKSRGSGRATGIQKADDAELALAKLRSYLAREAAPDAVHALRYHGAVLSIPACSGIRARRPRVSLRSVTAPFRSFIDVFSSRPRTNGPSWVVAEDVQWVDPTSIDLVRRLIARSASERIMFLITHRDDYQGRIGFGAGEFDLSSCKSLHRTNASRWSHPLQVSRCRPAPDRQPDPRKNRWRAAVRRGVYAGRDRFPRRRAHLDDMTGP